MTAETTDQHADPRAVSDQLGIVLSEVRYLRERLLSAREACAVRKTRACVAQLLTAMESHQKLGEMIADAAEMFTGKSEDDQDEALHGALRNALRTTEAVA